MYPIITSGNASKYISIGGKPIASGDVLLNKVTTSGILKPHSILKVTSLHKKATNAAKINPGKSPNEPILLKKLLLADSLLNGSENVVIMHTVIAINMDIG